MPIEQQPMSGSSARALAPAPNHMAALVAYSLISASMLLVNKTVLRAVPLPALVSVLQFGVSAAFCLLLKASGRVAVITGGASGVGLAAARGIGSGNKAQPLRRDGSDFAFHFPEKGIESEISTRERTACSRNGRKVLCGFLHFIFFGGAPFLPGSLSSTAS